MIAGEGEMAMAEGSDPKATSSASKCVSRKDKRKAAKKEKRKQKRKEVAEVERQLEEARLNDPEEQRRLQLEMEREKERVERERREFEERERMFLEALARKQAEQEEEDRRRASLEEEENKLKEQQAGLNLETNEDDEWEYVDEGPPEIIWQGNEIIVKKNRVKVKKKNAAQDIVPEDPNRPTSNPLPPQSEAFADYKNASVLSAEELLENVAQQTPNFGTEQDKAHCPFHLKTGACRFGSRCSRVHFYPDKSCTLLLKNMYNGPGLAWEQDEGLEHTDEEVERSYEEFYEDVHTEFLKFGEIINFKVCRNGSYHLRGNVYVHYKSLDSALAAYQSVNGRYFAGKQVTCEFVGVTRWKVAICGEFMRSRLKTCSRGTACNFIHCFPNPGGDYEWADWDKPPPRSWMEKMAALFGYSYESVHDRQTEEGTVGPHRNSSKRSPRDQERYDRLRSHSREIDSSNRRSREHYEKDNPPRIKYKQRHISGDPRDHRRDEFEAQTRHYVVREKRAYHDESRDSDVDENSGSWRKRSRRSQGKILASDNCPDTCSLEGRNLGISTDSPKRGEEKSTRQEFSQKSSRKQEASSGIMDTVGSHKTRSVSDDSTSGWRRTNDSDSTSDLSDGITQSNHSHRRKSSRHPSEVSRSSNNHIDDYPRNKSETMKLKSMRKTRSHKRELHSRKTSETECRDEHLKLYDRHGDRKSKLYHERSKSYDSDISGSHDCRESLEETDIRDRWVPDKVDAVKRDKHRRKSDRSYKKRESKDPGSHDSSSECSDPCFQDSRSRGSSKSKEGRSRGSRSSSDEKCKTSSSHSNRNHQEYGEDGRSHKLKSHRSDGKQESNESESHGWSFESSDACFKESRSRGSSKSKEGRTRAGHSPRNRKHKTSSTQIDSERKHKESGEGGSSHKRKKISSVGEE